MASDNAILREKRSHPPADYTFKIESFNLLADSTVERFESGVFETGGYNWRLVFYPKGNKSGGGRGHLSLYLKIDESNSYPDGTWSVNVYYRLFVFDQKRKEYLAVQDARAPMRSFDQQTSEWGFGKLITLASFNHPGNGYLVNNTCTFGVEVYVIKPTDSEGTLSISDNKLKGSANNNNTQAGPGTDCCKELIDYFISACCRSIQTLILDNVPCLRSILRLTTSTPT